MIYVGNWDDGVRWGGFVYNMRYRLWDCTIRDGFKSNLIFSTAVRWIVQSFSGAPIFNLLQLAYIAPFWVQNKEVVSKHNQAPTPSTMKLLSISVHASPTSHSSNVPGEWFSFRLKIISFQSNERYRFSPLLEQLSSLVCRLDWVEFFFRLWLNTNKLTDGIGCVGESMCVFPQIFGTN